MKLTTAGVRAMMANKTTSLKLRPLCVTAGVSYHAIRRRIQRGGCLLNDEGERLGKANARDQAEAMKGGDE